MVETVPPLLGAGVRFAVAGAIFLAILRLRGGPERIRITRAQALGAALAGNLLCFGGNGLVTVAELEVPSGLTALIIGSVPLWVVLMRLGEGDRPGRGTLAGVIVGFIGLAVLVLPGDRPEGAPLWGVLLIVLAAILWASGSFYSKRMTLPKDPLVSTAWQMLIAGGDDGRRRPRRRRGFGRPRIGVLDRLAAGAGLPDHFRVDARLHRVHVAAGQRADLHRHHLRVREPGDRAGAGRGDPVGGDHGHACCSARRRSWPPWRRWCARRARGAPQAGERSGVSYPCGSQVRHSAPERAATPARTRRRWWRRASPSG